MNPCKSRLRLWSSRLGRGFLACLLAMMFIPFMGTGKVAHAASPIWTSVGSSPINVVSLQNVNGTLYVGTENGSNDVWSYSNGTWTQMIGSPSNVYSLLDVNGTLYAGTAESDSNVVWTYSNGTWTQMIGSPSNVASLLDVNGTLYAGSYAGSNAVWTYSNGTWTQMIGSPSSVNSLLNVNGTLYAGATTGSNDVWSYSNGTWTQMIGSPRSVRSLLDVNGTLYAGTWTGSSNDVWSYSNGTWTQMIGSPSSALSLLDVNGTLYAGTSGNGVWTYSNGTWTQLSGSLSYVYSLQNVNGTLYAGAYDSGVHQLIFPVGAPANLQAGSTMSASTALSWDAVSGATGYNIYENGGNTAIATATSATYTVSGLTPNTPYTFTVSAFNAAGESAQSGAINVLTALSAPTGLTATAENGQVTLTWSPVSGTVTYSVYAGTASGSYGTTPVATVNGSTNSFTATGLTNGTTYYFAVTASNAGGSSAASNEASTTPVSANALLSSLSVDQGTLTPAFSTSQTNYSVSVANTVTSLDLSLIKGDPNQTLTVTGATYSSATGNVYSYSASNLIVGSNPIQIEVTAQNHTQNTYNLTVNRAQAPSSNADLSGLTLSSGTLTPAFASGETSYSASVANGVSSLTLTANTADSNATMTVNGATVVSGQASSAINLSVDSNPITIVVTAQNGTAKTYTITVMRAAASSQPSPTGGSSSTTTSDRVTSTDGKLTLPAGKTGEVSLGDAVTISIPADVTNKELKLTIEKLLDTQKLLTNKDVLASPVYEILKNFSENFSKPVTLTFAFDPASLKGNQKASVFYYDEAKKSWVEVGGKVNGKHITVEVNHFTKYAVFAVDQDGSTKTPSTDTKSTINFSDISGHWAEAGIKQAVSSGIVSGYQDGTFKPNQTVTRAEFAVMLMNTLKPQGETEALTFTDTAKIGAWAQKAVAQAVQAGIIKGYEDGSFGPDAQITRAEMTAMLAGALGQSIEANAATGFADDKNIPAWAKASVAYVKQAGIVQGKDDNQFAPQDHATRAEAVTVLLNMLAQKSK